MIRSRFEKLDEGLKGVLRGASIAIPLKLVGTALGFLINVVIARLLGVEGTGAYFILLSVFSVAVVIASFGLNNALLRFTSTHAALEEWVMVQGFYKTGIRIGIVVSAFVTVAIFFLAPWLMEVVFHKPELVSPLQWMSFAILPTALFNLQAESLKGVSKVRDAMLSQAVFFPLLMLLLIFPLVELSNFLGLVQAFVLSAIITLGYASWAWRSVQIGVSSIEKENQYQRKLWDSCKHLLIISLMNRAILPWAPFFFAGFYVSVQDVGVFGVAMRLSALIGLIIITVNNVVSPKLAAFYVKGDKKNLALLLRKIAWIYCFLTFPLLLFIFFYGDWLLALFGEDFKSGLYVLQILSVGQLSCAIFGPVGTLLILSGYEKELKNINIGVIIIMLVSLALMTPNWGIVGASFAVAIGTFSNYALASYKVYKHLNISCPIKIKGTY